MIFISRCLLFGFQVLFRQKIIFLNKTRWKIILPEKLKIQIVFAEQS